VRGISVIVQMNSSRFKEFLLMTGITLTRLEQAVARSHPMMARS
jgi:hypothetical protein